MNLEQLLAICAALSLLASVLLLMRGGIPWVWKLTALFVSGFYAVWFRAELTALTVVWAQPLKATLPQLGSNALYLGGLLLLVSWPLTLISALFLRSRDRAGSRIQRLVVATALFWLALLVDSFSPPFVADSIEAVQSLVGPWLEKAMRPPVQ